jgi:hypothetical protein
MFFSRTLGKLIFAPDGTLAIGPPEVQSGVEIVNCCGGPCWCRCGVLPTSWDVEWVTTNATFAYLAGETYNVPYNQNAFVPPGFDRCCGTVTNPSPNVNSIEIRMGIGTDPITGGTIGGLNMRMSIPFGPGVTANAAAPHGDPSPDNLGPPQGDCLEVVEADVAGATFAGCRVRITPIP